jgi:hypothetical protein
MWWHPHNKKVYEGLKGALEFLYSKKIWKKLGGGIRLAGVFLRTFQK